MSKEKPEQEALLFDEARSPLTKEQIKELLRPFDSSEIKTFKKSEKGPRLPYVSGHNVWDRLLTVIGPMFSLEVVNRWKEDDDYCVHLRMILLDKEGNKFVREDFGAWTNRKGMDPGDVWKSAHTDALKRLGRQLGIGNHLYVGENEDLFGDEEKSDSSGSNAGNDRQSKDAAERRTRRHASTSESEAQAEESAARNDAESPTSAETTQLTVEQFERIHKWNNYLGDEKGIDIYFDQFKTQEGEKLTSRNFDAFQEWLRNSVGNLVSQACNLVNVARPQHLREYIAAWNPKYHSILEIPVQEQTHPDRTPSAHLMPSHDRIMCFGCGHTLAIDQ